VLAVERVELDEPELVYNFTVKGPHTYFVLEVGVLVHNPKRVCAPTGLYEAIPEDENMMFWGTADKKPGTIAIGHSPASISKEVKPADLGKSLDTNIGFEGRAHGYVISGVNRDRTTFYVFNVRNRGLPSKFKFRGLPNLTREGTPTMAFGLMTQMKALGVQPGRLNQVTLKQIENFETLAALTRYAKDNNIPLKQLLENSSDLQKVLHESRIVKFVETPLNQVGLKINVNTIEVPSVQFRQVGKQMETFKLGRRWQELGELQDAVNKFGLDKADEIPWHFDITFNVEPF
jgi:hypothetical protein